MMQLTALQKRIKGSKIYKCKDQKTERLYFRFKPNSRELRISTWFEVVNDCIEPFVRVENHRRKSYFDYKQQNAIKKDILFQFREILNDCEMERKKVPLHIRLKDDILPVYDNRSLKHQVDALRFCCSMKVSALYDDTGTGKSKIAIDLAISRCEAGQINKVLVFLPVATKKNFQKQIKIWCNSSELEWKLIGHESMGCSGKAIFDALNFVDQKTMIIIDESHAIRTPTTKRSKRINMVCQKTSYKLVMTGTPVTDNIHNLYMQYAVLSPLIIGIKDWKKFEEKYLIMGGINGDEIIAYKNVNHLVRLIEPYTYQITKEEYLDLPTKSELRHYCSLSSEQSFLYSVEKKRLLKIINSDYFTVTDIFQAFTRMQQICCGYYRKSDKEKRFLENYKMELLSNIPLDEKIVFFCKYLFEIGNIVSHLGRHKCAIFTGVNPKERDSELADFVENRKQYFVVTMQSGGTGLNGLQKVSRRIVFFSNSFSYFDRKQSIGRIERQGQTREMFIHDFVTDAKIDDRIMRTLARKRNFADEIKEMMLDKTKLKQYVEEI